MAIVDLCINMAEDGIWRFCNEEVETPAHVLCHYEGLVAKKNRSQRLEAS